MGPVGRLFDSDYGARALQDLLLRVGMPESMG